MAEREPVTQTVATSFRGRLTDEQIAVPPAWITTGSPPDGNTRWRLADGSRVVAPYYEADLTLGPLGAFEATVLALGYEPIIGRGVIERFRVTLDRGRRVIVRL